MVEKPNLLLTASAIVYFGAGVLLLFAPQELLQSAGAKGSTLDFGVLQLIGGALLGYFMLNWTNRYSRVGGIYGRPVQLANFMHAAVGTAVIGHIVLRASVPVATYSALVVYVALAIAFGAKLFLPSDPSAGRNPQR